MSDDARGPRDERLPDDERDERDERRPSDPRDPRDDRDEDDERDIRDKQTFFDRWLVLVAILAIVVLMGIPVGFAVKTALGAAHDASDTAAENRVLIERLEREETTRELQTCEMANRRSMSLVFIADGALGIAYLEDDGTIQLDGLATAFRNQQYGFNRAYDCETDPSLDSPIEILIPPLTIELIAERERQCGAAIEGTRIQPGPLPNGCDVTLIGAQIP